MSITNTSQFSISVELKPISGLTTVPVDTASFRKTDAGKIIDAQIIESA